ncbi:hypothetical protein Tco_1007245 [Tanacetum coccineum]
MSEEDFAKRMVDLNQGTWKLSQLKKLKFEEIKEEFDKLVKQVDTFVPMSLKATKAEKGKRVCKENGKKKETNSKERPAEEKIEEEKTPKKTGKRVKSIARKGVHSKGESSHKDDKEMKMWLSVVPDEDKEGDYEPLDSKEPDEIYQNMITRSNGSKRFFSNIMNVLSRIDKEDLNAIHRMVMDKYRENEPEGFDRILWSDLRVMVHTIMTDIGIIVYMLIENRYPLERSVLSQMLDLKLQAEDESETALELIKFIKEQIEEMDEKDA